MSQFRNGLVVYCGYRVWVVLFLVAVMSACSKDAEPTFPASDEITKNDIKHEADAPIAEASGALNANLSTLSFAIVGSERGDPVDVLPSDIVVGLYNAGHLSGIQALVEKSGTRYDLSFPAANPPEFGVIVLSAPLYSGRVSFSTGQASPIIIKAKASKDLVFRDVMQTRQSSDLSYSLTVTDSLTRDSLGVDYEGNDAPTLHCENGVGRLAIESLEGQHLPRALKSSDVLRIRLESEEGERKDMVIELTDEGGVRPQRLEFTLTKNIRIVADVNSQFGSFPLAARARLFAVFRDSEELAVCELEGQALDELRPNQALMSGYTPERTFQEFGGEEVRFELRIRAYGCDLLVAHIANEGISTSNFSRHIPGALYIGSFRLKSAAGSLNVECADIDDQSLGGIQFELSKVRKRGEFISPTPYLLFEGGREVNSSELYLGKTLVDGSASVVGLPLGAYDLTITSGGELADRVTEKVEIRGTETLKLKIRVIPHVLFSVEVNNADNKPVGLALLPSDDVVKAYSELLARSGCERGLAERRISAFGGKRYATRSPYPGVSRFELPVPGEYDLLSYYKSNPLRVDRVVVVDGKRFVLNVYEPEKLLFQFVRAADNQPIEGVGTSVSPHPQSIAFGLTFQLELPSENKRIISAYGGGFKTEVNGLVYLSRDWMREPIVFFDPLYGPTPMVIENGKDVSILDPSGEKPIDAYRVFVKRPETPMCEGKIEVGLSFRGRMDLLRVVASPQIAAISGLERYYADLNPFSFRVNSDGTYRIPWLPLGEYELRVEDPNASRRNVTPRKDMLVEFRAGAAIKKDLPFLIDR